MYKNSYIAWQLILIVYLLLLVVGDMSAFALLEKGIGLLALPAHFLTDSMHVFIKNIG